MLRKSWIGLLCWGTLAAALSGGAPQAYAMGKKRKVDPAFCAELNRFAQERFIPDSKIQDFGYEPFKCPSPRSATVKMVYDLYAVSRFPGVPDFYSNTLGSIDLLVYFENGGEGAVASTNIFSGRIRLFGETILLSGEEYNASTLYHEARHLQAFEPGHVTCDHGSMKDRPGACDRSYIGRGLLEGSGYHYDIHFMNTALKSTTYDKLDRSILKAELRAILLNRINGITPEQVSKWIVR